MPAPKRKWDVCTAVERGEKKYYSRIGELCQWDADGADRLSLTLYMHPGVKFFVFDSRPRDAAQDEHAAAKANGYAPESPDGDGIPF